MVIMARLSDNPITYGRMKSVEVSRGRAKMRLMGSCSMGALMLLSAAGTAASAADTVKIGVVAAESGSFVSAGHTLPAGVSLAV